MRKPTCAGALAGFLVTFGIATAAAATDDADYFPAPWIEGVVALPQSTSLVSPVALDMGPTARNRFFVDRASLSVDTDGVVRFVIRVESAGGAINITYEGIRCSSRERRIYARARQDGTWSIMRSEDWRPIEARAINAYGLLLYRQFFCPQGVIASDTAEAVLALERGGHPSLRVY